MPSITRKVQLYPLGDKEEVDRVFKYLRDGMYAQNRAYNILISSVYSAIISGKSKEEIAEIYTRGQRKPKEDDPEYSLYEYGMLPFPKGLPIPGNLSRQVKADLKKSTSDGLFKGNTTIPNKKRTAPLYAKKYIQFYHNYESYAEFLDHLYKDDLELYATFVNGIRFKVVLGNPYQSHEMRSVFQNLFEEVYTMQESTIQFDKSGKKIMFNMCLGIPKKEIELNEDTVVGVDLGVAIPAVCGLNNNDYIRESIGSMDDFLRVRTQMQSQRKRLQKAMRNSKGGHGRKKKLAHLEKLKVKERNFAQTYNHMVSRRVVNFAIKNKAKYINLENLEGYDSSQFILRNWSYYELQQFITYKAGLVGIEVRKINPYHTSQICSCCGHWEEGQRISQSSFVCRNPECKNFAKTVNADFNASRNIAKSVDFK